MGDELCTLSLDQKANPFCSTHHTSTVQLHGDIHCIAPPPGPHGGCPLQALPTLLAQGCPRQPSGK